MKIYLSAFSLFFLFVGCASWTVTEHEDLQFLLFNGSGENVKVRYGDRVIMSIPEVRIDENNVGGVVNIERGRSKTLLSIERNGASAGRFMINPNHISTIYIFLLDDGSVIIEDGDKMPPML